MNIQTTMTLNNGVEIPILGLGVFRSPQGKETVDAVTAALAHGYRHIDTARIYRNEADVGAAVRKCGLPRESIFITTKLWESDQGYDNAIAACKESLRLMGLDYLDMFLIHWPVPGKRVQSWRALETLLDEGAVRAIGVSNYMLRHLHELMEHCRHRPAVNQIELSPYNYLQRKDLVDFCRVNGIAIEAYSPLTKGRKLDDPRLVKVARHHGRTPAQVLIRYCIQKDWIVLPKSSRPERIQENAGVFDWNLSLEDEAYLDSFNENLATGWDPTNAE